MPHAPIRIHHSAHGLLNGSIAGLGIGGVWMLEEEVSNAWSTTSWGRHGVGVWEFSEGEGVRVWRGMGM